MKCLLGLLACEGELHISGRDLRRDGRRARRLLGYVPQELSFHNDLSVLESCRFYAHLKQMPPDGIPDSISDVLAQVGLAAQMQKRVGALSGGMKQRLALALALLGDPPALLALLSFPAFWSNGYGLTQVGTTSLPLGSMLAGLNGLMWLCFAILYARATAHLESRPLPMQLWDWAILLLLVAFAGALGLVVLVALEQTNAFLQQAMLHLFLELFATGWFTLALLGLLWAWLGQQRPLPTRLPTLTLALLLAPTFLLGVNPALVPPHIFWISAGANFGAAILLAWHLRALWQQRTALPILARFGLLALGAHVTIALVLLWPGLWVWSADTQLRIFYLHNLLLGWVSSGLVGMASVLWFPLPTVWQSWLLGAWIGGVGSMLLALLGFGLLAVVPVVTASVWLRLAAWSSLLIAAIIGGFAWYAVYGRFAAYAEVPTAHGSAHAVDHTAAKRLRPEQR